MVKITSKKFKKLCHIIIRKEDIVSERSNLVSPKNFIQAASLKLLKNKVFAAHQHIIKKVKYKKAIAQEAWVVICGCIEVSYYDIGGSFLMKEKLFPGDCSITLSGGHGYKCIKNNTIVYEFKTGPYLGQRKDKFYYE